MSLIEQLGDVVDVVLETSHGHESRGHTDLYREYIDMPILQSTLWDFEDLLTTTAAPASPCSIRICRKKCS